jgi:hypothetical protein
MAGADPSLARTADLPGRPSMDDTAAGIQAGLRPVRSLQTATIRCAQNLLLFDDG